MLEYVRMSLCYAFDIYCNLVPEAASFRYQMLAELEIMDPQLCREI